MGARGTIDLCLRGRAQAVPSRGGRPEDGAAAVEMALLLPILFTLLFGMLSGGILLFQSITLSDAAREATRFAATVPVDTTTADWLDAVVDRVVDSANGYLDTSDSDHSICVALVGTPEGGQWHDGAVVLGPKHPCISDGRPDDEARVQVEVSRGGRLNAVFVSQSVTLGGRAVARFEVRK